MQFGGCMQSPLPLLTLGIFCVTGSSSLSSLSLCVWVFLSNHIVNIHKLRTPLNLFDWRPYSSLGFCLAQAIYAKEAFTTLFCVEKPTNQQYALRFSSRYVARLSRISWALLDRSTQQVYHRHSTTTEIYWWASVFTHFYLLALVKLWPFSTPPGNVGFALCTDYICAPVFLSLYFLVVFFGYFTHCRLGNGWLGSHIAINNPDPARTRYPRLLRPYAFIMSSWESGPRVAVLLYLVPQCVNFIWDG